MTTHTYRADQLAHETILDNREKQALLDNALQNKLMILSLNNDLDEITKLTIECNLLKEHREATCKLNGIL